MASEANLGFKITADASQGRDELARFTRSVKADTNVIQGDFGKMGGLIRKEMGDVAQSLANNTGALGRMASGFGVAGLAIGATAGAAVGASVAIFGLAKSAADAGSKFNDLSLKTGVSVETFSGLELQLKQSGTSMDALANAAVFMQKNLGEAASGNKELQKTFAALGVRDVRAALADTDGTLRTVVKSLGAMESAGERNAAGSKVMGRGFKELSVFLADTKGDLESVIEEARKAGQVMSDDAAAAADAFGDQLDALSHAASVAGRTLGMEVIPQITGAMRDLTGATSENASVFKAWGETLADIIMGVRFAAGAIKGFSFSDTIGGPDGGSFFKKLDKLYDRLADERDKAAGKLFDLNSPATAEQKAAGARERARALRAAGISAAGGDGDDVFSPGAGVKKAATEAESARKRFIETLHEWADAFNIPRSALRGIGSKTGHNKGSKHGGGLAADISPQFITPEAIEGARRMGLGVRDERTRPEGQKVWTGAHWHIEALSKARRAAADIAKDATEKENKAFEAQSDILDKLARAIVEGEAKLKSFTRASADQLVAAEYQSLGIGKLTGAAAELGEALFKEREQQIRAAEAAERHAEAIRSLLDLAERFNAEVDPASLVTGVGVAMPTGTGPMVDPTAFTAEFKEPPPPSFDGWKEAIGSLKDMAVGSFQQMGSALGEMVGQWVLYGSQAQVSARKMVASVLSSVAMQAAIQSVYEAAIGVAALTPWGFALYGSPIQHFKAAAMLAGVAAAAGLAGRAVAGGSFAGAGGGGGAFGDGTSSEQAGMREDNRSKWMREQAEKDRHTRREDRRESFSVTAPIVIDGREIARAVINVVRSDGDERKMLGHALQGAV